MLKLCMLLSKIASRFSMIPFINLASINRVRATWSVRLLDLGSIVFRLGLKVRLATIVASVDGHLVGHEFVK